MVVKTEKNRIVVSMYEGVVRLTIRLKDNVINLRTDINNARKTDKDVVLEDNEQARERFEIQREMWTEQAQQHLKEKSHVCENR